MQHHQQRSYVLLVSVNLYKNLSVKIVKFGCHKVSHFPLSFHLYENITIATGQEAPELSQRPEWTDAEYETLELNTHTV